MGKKSNKINVPLNKLQRRPEPRMKTNLILWLNVSKKMYRPIESSFRMCWRKVQDHLMDVCKKNVWI